MGGKVLSMEERVFTISVMFPLSFNRNYDGIKQSANSAIILAKILSYAPRAGFHNFLEAFPSSFSMTILPF